jgi:hypothetical protein
LVPGGPSRYRVSVESLRADPPAATGGVIYQESLPDELLLLQGTLMQDDLGLVLEYSTEKNKKFREATFSTLRGLRARHVLHGALDASSLADLFILLDMDENCVIEFATYEIDVGVQPNRNTVIFEVRGY